MSKYFVNRILAMIFTLFGVTIIVFLLVRLIPGTIVSQMLGTEALTSYETVESLRRYFGLDQPLYVQYLQWITPRPARRPGHLLAHLGSRCWNTCSPGCQ